MGPQLYRCGNPEPTCGLCSFSKLQWGRNFIVAETLVPTWPACTVPPASMGPQLYRCGNMSLEREASTRESSLQWGRNFIVAETRGSRSGPLEHTHASMGPQLYRCGNHSQVVRLVGRLGASMGPQLYRCGNWTRSVRLQARVCCFNGAATLSLRKQQELITASADLTALQWGRNFIVAETLCHTV